MIKLTVNGNAPAGQDKAILNGVTTGAAELGL